MTLSTVIPCYNSAATIGAAIRSVIAQTVRVDDIIVVDDGSVDGSAGVVEREFTCCRVIRQGNSGPAAARNRGVSVARGEWVAFLDGDDAWLPWRLQVQLSAAERRKDVALWCGDAIRVEENSSQRIPDVVPEPIRQRQLTLEEFVDSNPVATSTVMVRHSMFDEVGGFDALFRGPEDYDLWMRVAAKAPMVRLEAPLACHNVMPGSLSTDDRTFLPEVMRVIDKAFGPGGVLHGLGDKRMARAYQYLCAAWMASCRGAPVRAMRLVASSFMLWPWRFRNSQVRRWGRTRLAARILRDAVWS